MKVILSTASNFIRVCIAIAISLGVVTWLPGGDCARAGMERQCGCSMCAGSPACCVAPGETAPAQQPAAPVSRGVSEAQPLALADRLVVVMPMPEVAVIFPAEKYACRAVAAGHSFQSVRCIWTV